MNEIVNMDIPLIDSVNEFLSEFSTVSLPPEWQKGAESLGMVFLLYFFLWERMKECKRLQAENKRLQTRLNQLKSRQEGRREDDGPKA